MYNTIAMQILNGNANLVRQLLDSLLCQLEISELDVVKEILALHVLKHDVVVIGILEQIDEAYYVRVLRHLQYINFSSLLINFYRFHIFFMHCFNCYFLACSLV